MVLYLCVCRLVSIACDCNPEGTQYNGLCDSQSDLILGTIAGRCHCKENVEGLRCDKCKPSFYGLSGTDPQGCQRMQNDHFPPLFPSACQYVTDRIGREWEQEEGKKKV